MRPVVLAAAAIACALVALVVWGEAASYSDTLHLQRTDLASGLQISVGERTFDCPPVLDDAAEYFFADESPERRPCADERQRRGLLIRVGGAVLVIAGIVVAIAGWRSSAAAPKHADDRSPTAA